MKKTKVGIVGVGRMGQIHLDNLVRKFPEAEVVAISDISESSRSLAEKYTIPNFYLDYKDLISNPDVDSVVICSPTDQHATHIKLAAIAGKQIFCEKPMDLSLETVQEVLQVVEENNVKLMIAFNRRFDPNFMKVRNMVNAGNIGDPHIIKITSRDPAPPPISYIEKSGGLFLDMAIHDFDMARYIGDVEVTEVSAVGKALTSSEIEQAGDIDTAITTLSFENGAMATIDNSRKASYGYDQRLEVFGSEGMCGASNKSHDDHYFYNASGSHGALPLDFFMDRYAESYFNEMKTFMACLTDDTPPPCNGNDGIMSLAIGLAAKRSVREKRTVKISEIIN